MTPLLALLAALPQPASQPAPYAAPPKAGTPERLAFDDQSGGPAEDDAIERWLAANPKAPAAVRAMLFHRLCNSYGVRTGGEKRVAACQASADLNGGEDASDLQIAIALRAVPPVTASGSATIPLIANPLHSYSADITVNGVTVPWFMDTGAEISVVTQTTAAKLGVRVLGDSSDVGTSTSTRVTGKLGVIDTLTIGGVTVRNLPVLILPDAMLTITKDYTIPAIFGLQGFYAIKRVAWLDGGKRMALGDAAPAPSGKTVRVYWHESGLGIPLTTPLGTGGAQFDSGADRTSLRPSGLALLTPAQLASATERDVGIGGAGGIERSRKRVLPQLDYTLAGAPLVATGVTIDDRDLDAGRIGADMIGQLKLLVIDFRTMTLAAQPMPKP